MANETVKVPTYGEGMLDHDLSPAQIAEIEDGLMIPSQAAVKRMAHMIRVLQGDAQPDRI
jgi:hypothetical protein